MPDEISDYSIITAEYLSIYEDFDRAILEANENRNDWAKIKIENHSSKGKFGSILTPWNSRKQGSSGNNDL